MSAARRLPGLRFEVVSPPWSAALPRTDVAAFVGYASAGPLHVPVCVEDLAQFTEIFGGDLPPSAPEKADGGLLGPTVRAFFRHGGTRAWIVRGGEERDPMEVPLRGLRRADRPQEPCRLRTRSPGSAFTRLQVAPSVTRQPLLISGLGTVDRVVTISLKSGELVGVGDLLRIDLPVGDIGSRWLLGFVAAWASGKATLRKVWLVVQKPADASTDPPTITEPTITELSLLSNEDWDQISGTVATFTETTSSASRLQLDLRVTLGPGVYRLQGLGFHPDHPRYVGALPNDDTLFRVEAPERRRAWFAELRHPRFPLAGDGTEPLLLPLDWPETEASGTESPDRTQDPDGRPAPGAGLDPSALTTGIDALAELPEPALVGVPDAALPTESEASRRALHQRLLTLCQDRGDLFAVLCAPLKASARELGLDRDALAGGRSSSERERLLSHGMLVHPWVVDRPDAAAGLRPLPAVGHVLGRLAALTLDDGPWRSPGGQVFQDVIGLSRAWEPPERLLDSGASPVVRDVGRFMLLDARTLSDDPDLSEVPVRRLLILLRRLARQLGEEVAFEPNTAATARLLESRLAGALSRMQSAGAFRGRSGFRVRVTPGASSGSDEARLEAEIAINPAHPLRWLTVRLVQTNTGALALAEA